ncbi:MAG: serine/threonine-protein phosphatase [Deltaproteobacteria bacterium]|nr:serine/threonine-protein phosphatase [Deltaproteobacteria bacterium]MBW2052307.1 serine/threonine-protein phosphatase [Deltaproteobacteria bacterium]MBW2139763.1 serine/threonine-protein phosphatase [Deltaproteobacteria bacterium]MBW2323008.1 serine/threonine-protein phosphatase [Deltaproteobacteria bacterium]
MANLVGAACSDVGLNRDNNEDSFFFDDSLGLYLVADGMGGHAGGEVASSLVVQTITDYIKHFKDKPFEYPERYNIFDNDLSPASNTVLQAIHLANQVVNSSAQNNEDLHNMGSTLALIMTDGDDLTVAHVGDSRIFRHRGGELTRLTVDHRLSEDPQFKGVINYESTMVSTLGHTLTRAMGVKPEVMPDIRQMPFQDGDIYLLSSDGLTDMVSEEMIGQVLDLDENLDQKVQHLIELALAGGGMDNVTAVLAAAQPKTKSFRKLFNKIVKGN